MYASVHISDLTAKDWLTVVGGLVVGIVVAPLSAYVTVRLAFRRFYSEKQWELKADAYTKLLVALHQLKDHSAHELHLLETPPLPSGSEAEVERRTVMKRLEDEMKRGISELRLQIDIGTFVIAKDAVMLLERLMVGLDESVEIWRRDQSLAKHYAHRIKVVGDCQTSLRKIARNDLSHGWKQFR